MSPWCNGLAHLDSNEKIQVRFLVGSPLHIKRALSLVGQSAQLISGKSVVRVHQRAPHSDGELMILGDRLYWFSRNLAALISIVCFMPIYIPIWLIWTAIELSRIVLVSNGSETLNWPWKFKYPWQDAN